MTTLQIACMVYIGLGVIIAAGSLWQAIVSGDIRMDYQTDKQNSKHPIFSCIITYAILVAITVFIWPVPVAMMIYDRLSER